MNYKSITSATGWYFRDDGAKGSPIVWQLAAWAMTEAGDVVGLVAPAGAKNTDGSPKLARIPDGGGRYLHRDQLTDEEFKASMNK
ncbi:MAG TPA: hypothetical protein VFW53_11410 [Gallionella sp.]|nr:hypothetical protein [Gallionella sp.]